MTVSATNSVVSSVPEQQNAQHVLVRSVQIRTEEDCNGNDIAWNLMPGRHTPLELVYGVRNTFDHASQSGSLITPFESLLAARTSRLCSVQSYRRIFQSPPFQRRVRRIADWEINDCVQHAFLLFDEYFFLDQLRRYTRVELVQGLLMREGLLGRASNDPSRGVPYNLIVLDYQDANGSSLSPEAKAANMKEVLGVLLHEMVHVWFQIFKCKCARCRCDEPYMLGDCGHGFAWIELANVVQRVAREQFDCALDLHCGEDGLSVSGFREGLNMHQTWLRLLQ